MDAKQAAAIASRYTRFAAEEAHQRSPLCETLSHGVAGDLSVIDFLSTLPSEKRQPNLLLAAVRHLFGTPPDWVTFRETILTHSDALRAVMLTHVTQTNEPARCATLLPVLASLPQPLALIEVGASAGLCLLPDLYAGRCRCAGSGSPTKVRASFQRLPTARAHCTGPAISCCR
jgi:hypothetical protein